MPSRVTRVVTAQVMATLRTLTYRDTAITALSQRFDPATGAVAPETGLPDYVPPGFAWGVRRQLAARARGGGAPAGRLRITDLQGPPQTSAMARLSAADRQLAQLAVIGDELVLTVKLPTCPTPTGRAQWRRVRLTAAIPEHLHGRAITDWHLPTLVLDRRGLLWRCAATELVPADDLDSAAVAVGVDWSPSTLGAAAITAANPDGLVSDYRGWTYDDRGLGIKLARLQTEGQLLHRKAARFDPTGRDRTPRGPSTTRREDRRPRRAPNRCRRQTEKDQPGTGVPLRPPGHRLRRRRPGAADCSGRSHHPRDPRTRTRQQQPGRAVRPPPSRRRPRPHRRRYRHHRGLRAGPGIVRTVPGMRRTTCTPRRLPRRMVFTLPGRR